MNAPLLHSLKHQARTIQVPLTWNGPSYVFILWCTGGVTQYCVFFSLTMSRTRVQYSEQLMGSPEKTVCSCVMHLIFKHAPTTTERVITCIRSRLKDWVLNSVSMLFTVPILVLSYHSFSKLSGFVIVSHGFRPHYISTSSNKQSADSLFIFVTSRCCRCLGRASFWHCKGGFVLFGWQVPGTCHIYF